MDKRPTVIIYSSSAYEYQGLVSDYMVMGGYQKVLLRFLVQDIFFEFYQQPSPILVIPPGGVAREKFALRVMTANWDRIVRVFPFLEYFQNIRGKLEETGLIMKFLSQRQENPYLNEQCLFCSMPIFHVHAPDCGYFQFSQAKEMIAIFAEEGG